MELNLKRKQPVFQDDYHCKKLKTRIPHYCSERSELCKLKKTRLESPVKTFHATPMPHYPARLIHSHSFALTSPLNFSFHTEQRAAERAKFDLHVKMISEEREERSRALKEIQEKVEIEIIREKTLFKARPLPDYTKSPLRPSKSLKKLTVPIEKVLQTDLRAHLRNASHSINREPCK